MASKGSDGLTGFLSSPTGWILAGGVVYLIYQIWKTAKPAAEEAARAAANLSGGIADLFEGATIKPSSDPAGPAVEDYLTAAIVEDPKRGSDIEHTVKVAINNPGPPRVVELKVKARWVSRIMPNSETETSANVTAPTGRKVFEVKIGGPLLLREIAYDGYFQAYLDGKMAGAHRFIAP